MARSPRLRAARCCALALLALSLLAHAAGAKLKDVKVTTTAAAPACPLQAGTGDLLSVHYEGRLKDGTVFEETRRVGRTTDFRLGDGKVVEGWERGLAGMCVGETRRLVVPAHLAYGAEGNGKVPGGATTTFDVELVALNGRHLHEVLGEGATEGGGGGGVVNAAEARLGERAGQRYSPMCDACEVFVEQFFEGWVSTMQQQQRKDRVEQKSGGAEMPAITYNDDTEAYVQAVCTGRNATGIGRGRFQPFVMAGCERIMLAKKREVVGRFLAQELAGRYLPKEKAMICGEWMKACPSGRGHAEVRGGCATCRATAAGVALEQRTRRPPTKGKERQELTEVQEHVCHMLPMRHPGRSSRMTEACQDLMEEHGAELLELQLRGAGQEEMERKLCADWAGECSHGDVEVPFRHDEL